jgi:hypothetical protein
VQWRDDGIPKSSIFSELLKAETQAAGAARVSLGRDRGGHHGHD